MPVRSHRLDDPADAVRKSFVRAVRSGDIDTVVRMLDSREVPQDEPLGGSDSFPHNTPLCYACMFGPPAMVRLLIERGVDVNRPNETGVTPLTTTLILAQMPTLGAGNTRGEVVRLLLDAGADPNGKGGALTPLMAAVRTGNLDIARLLVERGASMIGGRPGGVGVTLHMADETGHPEIAAYLRSASGLDLHEAVKRGDADAAHSLLDGGTPPDTRDDRNHTPLHWAARAGRTDILSLLLERGADPNASDDSGCTPLMEAASGGSATAAHLLLERGADLDAENEAGQTALTRAALSREARAEVLSLLMERGARYGLAEATLAGRTELVRHLLAQGVPPDTADSGGMTALMAAAANGRIELAEMLLEASAAIDAVDQHGDTALLWAVGRRELGAVRFLLEHGADVNARCHNGETALHRAMTATLDPNRDVWRELFPLLLHYGADVSARTQDGFHSTPLLVAAHVGAPPEVAALLLDAGADIEERDHFEHTPLMRAVELGYRSVNIDLVRFLLERGADPRAGDAKRRWTVLSCARLGKSEPAIRLLMETLGPDYALVHAASQGDIARMKELLVAGVPPDAGVDVQRYLEVETEPEPSTREEKKWLRDDYGEAREHPLLIAAGEGQVEAVRLLLEHGADAGPAKNVAAMLTRFRGGGSEEGRAEVRRLLCEAGAVEWKPRKSD